MGWSDRLDPEKAPGTLLKTADGAEAYFPHPLPSGLDLPQDLHRLIGRARGKLGELQGIGTLSTNPALFVNSFQAREAAASSRIEGTKTTDEEALAHQVIKVETQDEEDSEEVNNYLRALRQGVAALRSGRRLNRGMIIELHSTLLQGVRGQKAKPGQLRDVQNFVGVDTIHNARFVPPPAIHVTSCLEDLQRYIDGPSQDDPLVRAALVHYQFETIHPFEDGNGRVGRLIVALQTIQEGLQQEPLLYVSSRLEANREEYYDHLLAVSLRGGFHAWIEFFVKAMLSSAEETTKKIRQLIATVRQLDEKVAPCKTPGPQRLLRALSETPFMTVKDAQKVLGSSNAVASEAVRALEELKVLTRARFKVKRTGRGRPPALYYCQDLVNILTE